MQSYATKTLPTSSRISSSSSKKLPSQFFAMRTYHIRTFGADKQLKFNDFYNPFREVPSCSIFFLDAKQKKINISLQITFGWEKERKKKKRAMEGEMENVDDIQKPTI